MTTTTETRTEGRKAAAAEKRDRMLAAGYHQSPGATWCGLCRQSIVVGQYVKIMPAAWQAAHPGMSPTVHHRCCERLTAWVRARAAGQNPPPLVWPQRLMKRRSPLTEGDRQRLARATEARQVAAGFIQSDGPKAARWVAQYVAEHDGTGPLWSELRRAMDWPGRPTFEKVIEGLHGAGWLTFSDETRSLRPGPAARTLTRGGRL
jgi:hypothetical protein